MFQTVVAFQGELGQLLFLGLAIAGGVLGAFLPPIGRMSRLPYFGCLVIIYISTYGALFALSSSLNVTLIFWGYIFVGVGTGIIGAWTARARSADIVGDGRSAYLAFIPIVGWYLVFATGKFTGSSITTSKTTTTKLWLALGALMGTLGNYAIITGATADAPNQFAKQVVAEFQPARIDEFTRMIGAEAVENRVIITYVVEGISAVDCGWINSKVCAMETQSIFEQAGIERELLYFDEDMNSLGSFVLDCR
jgi:hypothetical protein